MNEMTWQRIATRDPYLAGSIAARERTDEDTAEQSADSVGLNGEAKARFLVAWRHEVAEQAEEDREWLNIEQDAIEQESLNGDPAQ